MKQLVTYGLVGAVSSLIYLLVTVVLSEFVAVRPVSASAIGYCASFAFSFLMNHYVVFQSKKSPRGTLVKFSVVSAVGIALTSLIMIAATDLFSLNYAYGVAMVLIAIPLSNYLLNLYWAFRN